MKHTKAFDWSKIGYVLKGMIVGGLVGIVVSLFRWLVELFVEYVPHIYELLRENPWAIAPWFIVMLATAFIVIQLIKHDPHIQGSGIPELEGQLHGSIKMNWWSVLWKKFVGGLLAIGSGLALGREGPSIQLGGAVGQGVNQFLKGNKSQENVLISSGASAGLAAAFNAPMSGLMFILEEVHHKFSGVLILTAFSASVTANFVSFNIFGSTPTFDIGSLLPFPLENYVHLVFMGIFLAVAGWIYQTVLLAMPRWYGTLPIPRYLHGFIPFILVIPVGLFYPEMLGGGAEIITELSHGRILTSILLFILTFRFVFSHVSYGSGLPGGIFIPVLSLGAILGSIYGNGALQLTGIEEMYIRSFVIYAMGGFLTAVTKAPLTSVMLITELTGSVTQLMPLAVVSLSSYIVSDFIGSEPIYEALLMKKISRIRTVFKGEVTTLEIAVETDSQLDGMRLNQLSLPYGAKLIRVKRNVNEFIPHQDTVFFAGDELDIIVDEGFVTEVQKYISRLN